MNCWAEAWLQWMTAATWQLALLVGLVSVAALAARRLSARLRHALWLLVLAKMFLPPALAVPWSVGAWGVTPLLVRAEQAVPGGGTSPFPAFSSPPGTATPAASGLNAESVTGTRTPVPEATRSSSLPAAWSGRSVAEGLFAVWLGGVLLYSAAVAVPYIRLRRRLRPSQPVEEGPLAVCLEELCLRLGSAGSPRLLVSDAVSSPFLMGLFRPIIVIPAGLLRELKSDEVEKVLLHELIHWKRRDLPIGWLQVVGQALFWFHPLAWYANAELREERERACDEAVVAGGYASARPYAESLLHVLLAARGRSSASPGLPGIFERQSRLQRRLEEIMNAENQSRRFGPGSWTAVALFALVALPMGTVPRADAQPAASPPAASPESPRNDSAQGDNVSTSSATTVLDPALLNEEQRLYLEWTEGQFGPDPSPERYADVSEREKAALEGRWLTVLEGPETAEVYGAISALAALRSPRAVRPLLRIASEEREKNNRGRWMAIRALGLIGDASVVPELIHLVYHPNQNTRQWAQISLVRLTGRNFGYDWKQWGEWWNAQGATPRFTPELRAWLRKPEDQIYMDPERQKESDREFFEKVRERKSARAAGGKERPTQSGGAKAEAEAEADRTPPRILDTFPPVGATAVDPATTAIVVTFDRDMAAGFSWTGGGPEFPPAPQGGQAHWISPRTCVLPVQLQPASYYRVGINSTSFQNFRSRAGIPALPSAIYFTTEGAGEDLEARVRRPKIVSLEPPNGATGVDPGLAQLRVTFDMPMGGGFSWTGGGFNYPAIPEGERPRWSDDRKSCILPVKLEPDHEYRLGLNSPSHKNFQSAWGVPFEPVVYSFRTGKAAQQ